MASASAGDASFSERAARPACRVQMMRTLTWSYRRAEQQLTCVLGLTPDCSSYELRLAPARLAPGAATELLDAALAALQRHDALQRALFSDGWRLDRFAEGRRVSAG